MDIEELEKIKKTLCFEAHKAIDARVAALEDKDKEKRKASWQFVGTAALAALSMIFNILMIFFKGGS
jgi:hypothetical protein